MANPNTAKHTEKHQSNLPSARKIRRACNNELYRAVKRMKVWIPEESMKQGEELYYKKVILNLIWIHEHSSNRKLLSDWWDENVCEELATLWDVDRDKLSRAFREAFGG
ncbi:dehydrogenase [Paenibacillus selenitireducens]|uniref:Dehydrogenase n=1 Tax=Paenibacillus selenitireducens TaxID=1324314 RepID=A0A1T2X354_9BACL|nr:dehydrogenase [Paenibacillus selenitireducens]OPA74321.1 dehydrogenase [Paenibacillus selenitireducens]